MNELINNDFIGKIEEALKENNNSAIATDILFSAQRQSLEQIDIIQRFNGVIDSNTKNKNLVLIEFPEVYINQLEKLIYPDWFTACFMSEASNSSVWGHYSDNHKGVCLVFNPEIIGQKFFLSLRGVNGWSSTSGPTFSFSKHELLPINYKTGYGQIDFFKSLGRLSRKVLDSTWFSKDGKISICSEDMYKSEEDWRKRYWEAFYRDITVKTKDWEYENEYRIILASSLDSYSKDEHRTLIYDFQSLSGIIFGIKTSKEDKIRILKIIDKKCEESKITDFKFYQAYYSNTDNSIKYNELSLIKFKSEV